MVDSRAQLQRILDSNAFRAPDALRRLLIFVVEEMLAGRSENVKEYLLGAMVLGKGESFDPKLDPIVRVQMRRLRERLMHYYATEGRRDAIVIELPRGTYVPSVYHRPLPADEETSSPHINGWSRFSAYELDLKARYLLGQRNVALVRQAAALIEDVLEKHPGYAPAYVTLAECYRQLTVLEVMPPLEVVPKMRAACKQALQLDPNLAEAHAAFAGVLGWEWDFASAEEEYIVALGLQPPNALTYMRYAIHLAAFGRFAEAIECAERACELEPLSPACEHARGVVHYWKRDYARAADCAHRAVAIAPAFSLGHHLLGFVCLHRHEHEQAVDALEHATTLSGASTFDRGYQAYGLGCADKRDDARDILEELVATAQHQYVAPMSIAHCYLGLGDLDEALSWIERAYAPAIKQWPYFLAAPFYEPLFGLRRFQHVVERIGLPLPLVAR